jgi:hypothetical protein
MQRVRCIADKGTVSPSRTDGDGSVARPTTDAEGTLSYSFFA